MKKKTIGLLDSGIGGLSVLAKLNENLFNTKFVYFGDSENAPYGNRGVEELWSITISNLVYLNQFNLDALVVACNTLSVTLYDRIKDFSSIEVYPTLPPVESVAANGERTLLLSTVNTAKKYLGCPNVKVLGLKHLAYEIEMGLTKGYKVDLSRHLSAINSSNERFSSVILGCTHYELIKNEIFDHLKPNKIICASDLVLNNVNKTFKKSNRYIKTNENEVAFIGKHAKKMEKLYKKVVKDA